MKRFFALVITVCMVVTASFAAIPNMPGIVPAADTEVHAASYPALKAINYRATGDQRKDIVGFAKTQVGYAEKSGNNTYFGAWFGMNRQPWCAMFICWAAAKAGVPTSVVPKIANADRSWAKKQNVYFKSKQWGGTYIPKPGDLIYFSWSVRDYADHIGMVSGTGKVNGVTYVYTIEGNKHDKVTTGSYAYNNRYILGYSSPKYKTKGVAPTTNATTVARYTVTYNANGGQNAPAQQTKEANKTLVLQKGIPTRVGYTFLGWAESATATTAQYSAGGNYTANKQVTLFAVWRNNTYQVKVNKANLPKRTGPGLNYEQKGSLALNSTVTVVETRDGWGKLSDGLWIMLSLTTQVAKPTTTTNTTTKPTTRTTTPPSTSGAVGVYRITGDLFKREGPAKTYKKKGVLKKGATVTIIAISNGWGKMADGTWSSMKYMQKVATTTRATTSVTTRSSTGATTRPVTTSSAKIIYGKVIPSGGLNKRGGPGTSYKKRGWLKKNTSVAITTIRGGWGQIRGSSAWVKLYYINIASGYTIKVTTTQLHMRTGASKKYKSVGYIKPGTYYIKQISHDGAWGKLRHNNRWVMLKYTTRI